ncbi:hypothetical protein [Sarcina sp. DSM 11001]|uniref:hypothetical protein n=1 Tax=Sarcina sp. DSM 11001 TaxID=1798184 RepID=UPI001113DF15|nr:hypothetical protein [Sarcina sp. DSM 11001]
MIFESRNVLIFNKKIYAIKKTVETLNKQLKAIPKNIFHRKERRIIEKKIASEKEKLKKQRRHWKSILCSIFMILSTALSRHIGMQKQNMEHS